MRLRPGIFGQNIQGGTVTLVDYGLYVEPSKVRQIVVIERDGKRTNTTGFYVAGFAVVAVPAGGGEP